MKKIFISFILISIAALCFTACECRFEMASVEDYLTELSRQKWDWMSQKDVESLDVLFHNNAVFVHMGATMNKHEELETIRSGGIRYRDVDIQDVSVKFVGNTAILLNKIRLVAVVGGNEVENPFVVTEVYVYECERWTLGSMSFTRLIN